MVLMLVQKYPEVADYYVARIQKTIPNTRQSLDTFRKMTREVLFTRHGYRLADGHDLVLRRQRRDSDAPQQNDQPTLWPKGSPEHEIVAELAAFDHELVIDKNSSSPFNATEIDQLVRNLGLETLVLTGMAPDMCVETTARDAVDRGYNVIVVEDAVATFFAEHHDAALSALGRVYAQVWSTDRVLSALEG